ncbi:uncharacterized protein LOC134769778 [Penaeus indicus]|uniref:uncharacterized protein LOC134769778 n=1 Tax=Penaeus indicus TaxID=29960 RepID=UPI00300C95E5
MEGVYWCRESTVLLLEKVKAREPIWNMNHTNFMKKNLKRSLFDEICQELKKEYPLMNNLTTDMVVSRYQYLRGHFQKQLRKIYNVPSSSRRTASHKWEFFKACTFMQSGFMINNNESSFTSTLRKQQLPSDSPNTATSQDLVVKFRSHHLRLCILNLGGPVWVNPFSRFMLCCEDVKVTESFTCIAKPGHYLVQIQEASRCKEIGIKSRHQSL